MHKISLRDSNIDYYTFYCSIIYLFLFIYIKINKNMTTVTRQITPMHHCGLLEHKYIKSKIITIT